MGLNKQKMASQPEFLERLGAFVSQLPSGCTWCIESRNPNYLNDRYFGFLREHGLAHVWLQGYYMPPIFGLYEKYADQLTNNVAIRLHGPDREVDGPRDLHGAAAGRLLHAAVVGGRYGAGDHPAGAE